MDDEQVDFLVLRYSSGYSSTLGLLFRILDEKGKTWLCHTLEDEHRTLKVSGETRIPAGRYQLGLRLTGGHHTRYRRSYP